MDKWYKKQYRRNLVDMHIADYDDLFLSRFNAEDYFKYLKEAQITAPMIYLQSHTGLCNFPTKVSKTHEFFKKNPSELKKLISLCKNDGMKVVGYYSLIFNNQAIYDHPNWEMRNADGTTWRDHAQRYGLACPNNKEYREFLHTQLLELHDEYGDSLDGLFFDMPYWEVECHCPSCQEEWKKYSDQPIPSKSDFKDPIYRIFQKARQDFMGDFTRYVKKLASEIFPKTTIEFNFAAVVGCDYLAGSTEQINEECEFTGGDLYGDLYNHSFTAKYYYSITKNQPFEYMTCRCNHNLREHTINKNDETLEAEIMLSCMHHGASLIIDAINPDGSLDHRVSSKIGKAFSHQLPYEKYMEIGDMYGDIGLFFDSRTQFKHSQMVCNKDVVINASKTLIENHISYRILANKHLGNLSNYKLVIAPNLDDFFNEDIDKFINYVKDGGTLYLSGYSVPKLLKEFFDGEITGETFGDSKFAHFEKPYNQVQAYVRPITAEYKKYFGDFDEKYPLPITYKLPILKHTKGTVEAMITLPYTDPDDMGTFASIHSNPPGKETSIPAIVSVKYGKGKVIYSAAAIEGDDRYNFKDIFINIISKIVDPLFKIQGSKFVESIVFKENDDSYLLNLFDLNLPNEKVDRQVTIRVPEGFGVYDLLTSTKFVSHDNIVTINFSKYISLKIEKES